MRVRNLIVGVAATSVMVGGMVATAAAAATVANGSFENGLAPGLFLTLTAGDNTSLDNWTVSSGNIDVIGTYWTSSDGSRSLDLNGLVPGGVSQVLTTVAGHTYEVSFDLSGNPDGGGSSPAVKTLDVDAGAAATPYSFDTTGHTTANMGWTTKTFNFTATGNSTTLRFTSTTTGGALQWFGPALDNVRITDKLTNKDQCKNNGWKEFTSPTFRNQGDCVSYFQSNPNATGNRKDNI